MKQSINAQNGFVLASLLITTTFVLLIGTVIAQLVIGNYLLADGDVNRLHAQTAADAGLDYGIIALNTNNSWSGTAGGEVDLLNTGDIRTTYEVTVAVGSASDEKIITSIGRTYEPASATSPTSERTFEVLVEGLAPSSGNFSIVTGVGGLFMENNTSILAGDVLVNGELEMSNSAQIGTSSNPVLVNVAHQNCPSGGGASYPEVCTSGQPISMNNFAHIYADVCAKNQTDGSSMSNGGLDTSCSGSSPSAPTPQPLPEHDRDAQIAAVTNTITGDYLCDSNSAVLTIPANTRITGNMEIQKQCNIIIEGDVWVEGSVILKNQSVFTVSETVDTGVDGTLPTLMVDGQNGLVFENSSGVEPNSSDLGIQFITYWSVASCSPDCDDVTGTDLYNSRESVTILLKNSASAEESLLYARWTQAQLDNGGDIGAIVGQTVKLTNSAAVTFGASAGGGGSGSPNTFVIREYRRVL